MMQRLKHPQPCHRCQGPAVNAYDGTPTCVLCRAEEVRERLPEYNLSLWQTRPSAPVWEPRHD